MLAKKIFKIFVHDVENMDGRIFLGTEARDILHLLYTPEFLILKSNSGHLRKYQLIDRTALPTLEHFNTQIDEVFEQHTIDPTVFLEDGLYIHKSVISRIETNLQYWEKTAAIFKKSYGHSTHLSLNKVATTFLEFLRAYSWPNQDFKGVVYWLNEEKEID